MEQGISRNTVIGLLTKSPHGKLEEYTPIAKPFVMQDPEFYAHLVAWNQLKGQVRDAKVALPAVSLAAPGFPPEFVENSFAHLALLSPRELLRAYRFARGIKAPGMGSQLKRFVHRYLKYKEGHRWDRTAIQHRAVLKELYALSHAQIGPRAKAVLFEQEYPKGSVFEAVHNLKDMSALEAAGVVAKYRIPFLIAHGALGAKAKEPDVLIALINAMSPTELTTNSKALERAGMKALPGVRAAYQEALERAAKSTKNALKASKAVESVEDDALKAKLVALQEKQIKQLGGIEGNWLVLGDKSGSMHRAIETAVEVASTLAKFVKGKVSLVFFDVEPTFIDVTGLTYGQIKERTKHFHASGGTSIGCGLRAAMERNADIDGIAVISDGGENNPPFFVPTYQELCVRLGKSIPVYQYVMAGDPNVLCLSMRKAGLDIQMFDQTTGVTDSYSLPNLVSTMRVQRYGLVDEVMATPLLTLAEVFKDEQAA